MYQDLIEDIVRECRTKAADGVVASYIPELAKADAGMLGMAVAIPDEGTYYAGDAQHLFTIQSISKMMVFTCCLMDTKIEHVLEKISLEPTSESFNSIASLEIKNFNKPLNPMINSGAIAGLTMVKGSDPAQKFNRVLEFIRLVSGNPNLDVNEDVYRSERATGSRNRALAYYMQSTGIIEGEVEPLLDAYFRTCSIEMNCEDLANTALVYAQKGRTRNGEQLFSRDIARTVTAVIGLCGMYDESGSYAVKVGLPSKSGVGGGILSVAPGKMGIGVFGPALNERGSSVAGVAAVQRFSRELDLSVY